MKFNYGKEKRKFEAMWEKLREEYKEAGMKDCDIQKMYEYDWEMFKKERVFCTHNQFMPNGAFDDGDLKDEGQNPLLCKYKEQLSISDKYFEYEEGNWSNEIENPIISVALRELSKEQMELLERSVFKGETLDEISMETGLGYYVIANRLSRIKRKLRRRIEKGEELN